MEAELVGGLSDSPAGGMLVDIRAERGMIEPDEFLAAVSWRSTMLVTLTSTVQNSLGPTVSPVSSPRAA